MIIFVGDRPSPKMKPGAKPFEGAVCEKRLKHWIKCLKIQDESYEIFNRHDLGLVLILDSYLSGADYKFIALGENASKYLAKFPHFKLPHPSGRNRLLNHKPFIVKQLTNCYDWLWEEYEAHDDYTSVSSGLYR